MPHALPPQILSGQEVFDLLMQGIEPELTSEGKKNLAQKYAGETSAQKAERKARYQKAFEGYDKAYENYMQKQRDAASQYRRTSFAAIEQDSKTKEDATLVTLSASFS